jgi:hypothetical protein
VLHTSPLVERMSSIQYAPPLGRSVFDNLGVTCGKRSRLFGSVTSATPTICMGQNLPEKLLKKKLV